MKMSASLALVMALAAPLAGLRNQAGRVLGDAALLAEKYPLAAATVAGLYALHPATPPKLLWRQAAVIWPV